MSRESMPHDPVPQEVTDPKPQELRDPELPITGLPDTIEVPDEQRGPYDPELPEMGVENNYNPAITDFVRKLGLEVNPVKKAILGKGLLYTSYVVNHRVRDAVRALPENEKIFFGGSKGGGNNDINFWATMDRLGVPFVEALDLSKEETISLTKLYDNALTAGSNLRSASSVLINNFETPGFPQTVENATKMLMSENIPVDINNKESLIAYREEVSKALKEMMEQFKNIPLGN